MDILRKSLLIPFAIVARLISSCDMKQVVYTWHYERINADVLSERDKKKDVIVGVVDSGLNEEFLDLFDGKTIIDGYDFIDDDDTPFSSVNIHGSQVSYLIAGSCVDGMIGIDPRIKIMPIRVVGEMGVAKEEDICDGIQCAIDKGCSVINLSIASSVRSDRMASIIQSNQDVIFVSSIGDMSNDEFSYPSLLDGVVAVLAVDYEGKPYEYSDVSPTKESIKAPGVDIEVPSVNAIGKTIKVNVSGFSYATAIVSGIIASCMLSDGLNNVSLQTLDLYTDGYLDCRKFLK